MSDTSSVPDIILLEYYQNQKLTPETSAYNEYEEVYGIYG